MERVRFRQGLRSNPQGLALTGSHARLCSQFFWRKNGRWWSSDVLYSLRVEYVRCLSSGFGAVFDRKPDRWFMGWYAGRSYPFPTLLCIADRGIKPLKMLSVYHADDSSAARRREDHIPVLVRVPLYRGDHIHRHGYIPPQFLLIPNVRREHFDMSDSCADAWGFKQWGVSGVHTPLLLLY